MSLEKGYTDIIGRIKTEIESARIKAAISVNQNLLILYWKIGTLILQQQNVEGWGTKVIAKLSEDLRKEFPDMKGMSVRNLKYMRAFAEAYPLFVQQLAAQIETEETKLHDSIVQPAVAQLETSKTEQSHGHIILNNLIVQQPVAQMENTNSAKSQNLSIVQQAAAQLGLPDLSIVQQLVAQLPWGQHMVILDKIRGYDERIFYINKAIENGWSRNVLVHQIESGLYSRQGKAVNNFTQTLPAVQSDLAREMLKDPYKFDFLNLSEEYFEKDLEDALVSHITKFLLELGAGFSYVGRQYHLEVGGEDFYVDMMFYHLKLRCYVVIELKTGKFIPEYASKLNFYLNAVDDKVRYPSDSPTIGILICKESNKIIAEYALRGINKPIGVAEYELTQSIPEKFKGSLPTIEEIENELGGDI